MIIVAFVLLRWGKNAFVEHLALAVSLAGQALVVWAIVESVESHAENAWLLVTLLQMLLAVGMPNFVHRVFSSFAATYAFSLSLTAMGLPYVSSAVALFLAAWLWLNEFNYPRHMRNMQAIAYGLVLALVPFKGSALYGHAFMGMQSLHDKSAFGVQPWMGEVLAGAVMIYVVWQLLQRLGKRAAGPLAITAILGTLILCAVSLEARGLTVGLVIMLLGFAGGNRILSGLGIVALLFYISSYYYLLESSLLVKSQILFVTGLILLAIRWLIMRMIPAPKEVQHA